MQKILQTLLGDLQALMNPYKLLAEAQQVQIDEEPDLDPEAEFPGRLPTEIILSSLLFLAVTANIAVTVRCQVYNNKSSLFIITILSLQLLVRLVIYLYRILTDEYIGGDWVMYRVSTDVSNFLLGIVALVLLV